MAKEKHAQLKLKYLEQKQRLEREMQEEMNWRLEIKRQKYVNKQLELKEEMKKAKEKRFSLELLQARQDWEELILERPVVEEVERGIFCP